ncbi:hypothetical protein MMO38_13855 [Acinetobacter sp. NIPH 1852]|uniref:hypothetical protein n=1 Tax=Acinetobacter sp. NIPH 1852 TaxID=2923428 RepID=UPI001F4A380A|nr:hypothetical protein [Acinetobacter sp. NIPH 1852]MCH7309206.1 hypothetical protein [Acinetobacter sp. NIPH 1852]
MKAVDLIKNHDLDYAVNIINSAPSNATEWNDGFEFKCGQNAVSISPEDREKYFVDLIELRRVVESLSTINELDGIDCARTEFKTMFFEDEPYRIKASGRNICKDDLWQSIQDWESVYG